MTCVHIWQPSLDLILHKSPSLWKLGVAIHFCLKQTNKLTLFAVTQYTGGWV